MQNLSPATPPSMLDYREPAAVMTRLTLGDPTLARESSADVIKLLAPVRDGLALVEAKMRSVDASIFAPLATAFLDLIGSGGKRLRPALALLSAELGAPGDQTFDRACVIALAAAVEMLHTSTLVHDDVIDGALLRRGAPTLNANWSGGATVLAGNYMFGAAAHFSAETQNPRVIRLFADTLKVIVDGELRQLSERNYYQQGKDNYYQRIYAKTASLFCAATEGAAILAGMPEPVIQQLREYGYNFGMAFQIVDDMLDFTGSVATLGKPAGSDLRQGTLTLPFFYFLRRHAQPETVVANLTEAHELLEAGDPQPWQDVIQQTVSEVRASSAIPAAQQEAVSFLGRARASLAGLQESVYKQSLLGLCDFVVERTY